MTAQRHAPTPLSTRGRLSAASSTELTELHVALAGRYDPTFIGLWIHSTGALAPGPPHPGRGFHGDADTWRAKLGESVALRLAIWSALSELSGVPLPAMMAQTLDVAVRAGRGRSIVTDGDIARARDLLVASGAVIVEDSRPTSLAFAVVP